MAPGVDIDRAAWGEPQQTRALDTYLRAVGAHWLLVVAVALVTFGASVMLLSLQSQQYRATAQLLISPLPQDDDTFLGLPMIKDSGDPTRTIQTAAALLESPAAARATAQRLGADWTEQRVLDHIDIEPEGESDILDVSAQAGSGTEAQVVANAFVAAALEERDTALRRAAAPVIDRLRRIRARLPRGDPSASDLDSRIARLEEISVGGDPTVQLSRDATSSSAEGAPSWLVVVLALGAGVILGSAAALLTERLGAPTIRAEDELAQVDPAPVLARVPDVSARRPRPLRPFPFDAPLPVLASFRSVDLQLRMQEGDHRTILFTSPSPGDGTTTSVINFALALASGEQKVIVFDLDLRQPDVARTVGVAEERNLLSALASRAGLGEVLAFVPGVPMIRVVPGISDADGRTLEHVGRRLPDLIAEARSMASYVLIDTPSLGAFGDSLRFIGAVDDVVLVARLNRTRVADVETVRELLRRAGKPATGYILVEGRAAPLGMVRDVLRRAGQPAAAYIVRAATAARLRNLRGRPRTERSSVATEPVPGRPPPRGAAAARMAAATTSLTDLIAAGILPTGAELVATAHGREYTAHVRGEHIEVNGTRYTSLSAAAASITGKQTNGWTFWHARVNGNDVSLAQLRADLRRRG